MAKHIEDEVAYYYDFHPTQEDLMGETAIHRMLVSYLMEVLTWLFRGQRCALYANLNFYQTANRKEYPLAPDIAVIKGVDFELVRSWRVSKTGPAPQVVFEIASEETWQKDLEEKPGKYALMGVEEYFAYDPNESPIGRGASRRLFGWQLDKARQQLRELSPGADGHLWSSQLDSFLVPEGEYLRLYDRNGQLRLTGVEAEAEARRAEAKRAEAEAEARRAEARRAEAEAEARRTEARRADEQAKRAEELAEKLRSLGIDPNQI